MKSCFSIMHLINIFEQRRKKNGDVDFCSLLKVKKETWDWHFGGKYTHLIKTSVTNGKKPLKRDNLGISLPWCKSER